MSQTGFAVFDQTVQQTNNWLGEISEEMNHPDRQVAYHALRGVLFALRDRLTVEEAVNLGSQLPLLVRGIYFEAYKASGKPETIRDRDVFIQKVTPELQAAGGADPEAATRAVFTVLARHISEGQARHVREMLPEAIRTFWPEEATA